MSTKNATVRVKAKSKGKRRPSLNQQRVLWLAQDIFARAVSHPQAASEKYTPKNLARAAILAAKTFWTVAKEKA